SHVFDKDPVTIATHSIFLHDALPISGGHLRIGWRCPSFRVLDRLAPGVSRGVRGTKSYPLPSSPSLVRLVDHLRQAVAVNFDARSEEHTSELQSRENLVCRLLLEKKK